MRFKASRGDRVVPGQTGDAYSVSSHKSDFSLDLQRMGLTYEEAEVAALDRS